MKVRMHQENLASFPTVNMYILFSPQLNFNINGNTQVCLKLSALNWEIVTFPILGVLTTLYNVCAVPWGVLSTVGGVQYRGGYLEYRGGVQYRGGYHDKCGGYLEYRGGYLEYRGGYHDARGGYHDARGGISWVPWRVFSTVGGKIFCYLSTPRYWTPPRYSWYPHMYHDIPPRYSNFKGWYPPRYWTPPTVLMISPHMHHDIPHGTEHPPRYSR